MILFVLFALFCLVVCQEDENVQLRIMHGVEVPIEKFPYEVSLEKFSHTLNESYIGTCGGSIISDIHIITAAHCIGCLPNDYIKVMFGVASKFDDKTLVQNIEPENMFVHEQYCTVILNNVRNTRDIGLIKLHEKLNFSNKIHPISLPSDFTTLSMLEGRTAVISGWGLSEIGDVPVVLNAASIEIAPTSFCDNSFVPDDHICSNIVDHTSICIGDSGGPLVISDILYGIISYGHALNKSETENSTCYDDDIAAYTSIVYYLDWIKEKTGLLPGREAKPKKLPYFVRLTSYFKTLKKPFVNCAGSLISHRHVLTTAHCVKHKELNCAIASYVQTRFGISSLSDLEGVNIKILPKNIKVHDKFRCQRSPLFDIAIIRIPNPLEFTESIKAIKLPSKRIRLGNLKGKFSSFGSTHLGVPPKLLRIHKINISLDLCENAVCGYTTQLSSCNIDPGAPIGIESTFVGMISQEPQHQENCVSSNISMIVNIVTHINWIKAQLNA